MMKFMTAALLALGTPAAAAIVDIEPIVSGADGVQQFRYQQDFVGLPRTTEFCDFSVDQDCDAGFPFFADYPRDTLELDIASPFMGAQRAFVRVSAEILDETIITAFDLTATLVGQDNFQLGRISIGSDLSRQENQQDVSFDFRGLDFEALQLGGLKLLVDYSGFSSGDDDLGQDGFRLDVGVSYGVSAVPLPASGWILLAGLGLISFARKRH